MLPRRPLRCLLLLAAGLAPLVAAAQLTLDIFHPLDLATTPLQPFITAHFVDPAALAAVSRFRSAQGHPYADEYEDANQSMKHYLAPLASYLGSNTSLAVYAPTSGFIADIQPEQHILTDGSVQGYQVYLIPDPYFTGTTNPNGTAATILGQVQVRLFHINVNLATLHIGDHVTAGSPLGYADLRLDGQSFDIGIDVVKQGFPPFPSSGRPPQFLDPSNPANNFGLAKVSYFDVMDDPTFAGYLAAGATARSDFSYTAAYRAAHPLQLSDFGANVPADWVQLNGAPAVPEPGASAVLAGAVAMGLVGWSRRSQAIRRRPGWLRRGGLLTER